MTSHDARLQRLEVARWRREAAKAGAPHGYSADDVLDESLRFLEMPFDQRVRAYPDFTEAEHREMQTWLPTIRRARGAGRSGSLTKGACHGLSTRDSPFH